MRIFVKNLFSEINIFIFKIFWYFLKSTCKKILQRYFQLYCDTLTHDKIILIQNNFQLHNRSIQ